MRGAVEWPSLNRLGGCARQPRQVVGHILCAGHTTCLSCPLSLPSPAPVCIKEAGMVRRVRHPKGVCQLLPPPLEPAHCTMVGEGLPA